MKKTIEARIMRVEYATYVNTLLIAAHIGIPIIVLWGLFYG